MLFNVLLMKCMNLNGYLESTYFGFLMEISCSFLCRGAFSSVVLGIHKETDKKCAIKIIDKTQVCDTEQRRTRVLTEIGILRQCDHPHILKVHEIYETDIDISLVLDLYVQFLFEPA